MEFRIQATSGFGDVVSELKSYGYEIYDLDHEELPLTGKIELSRLSDLVNMSTAISEELIIFEDRNGQPVIEVYNNYRE